MSRLTDPSKWPAGATHYHPAVDGFVAHWIKVRGADTYYCSTDFESEGWRKYVKSCSPSEHWIELKPVDGWTGEGLPPVGTVCEYQCGYVERPYRHAECTVIAHFVGESGKSLAAFTYVAHDGVVQIGRGTTELFRPISTPEQIADDERSAAICEMSSITGAPCSTLGHAEILAALYDAGYRKQAVPPLPEEDTSDIDYSIKAGDTVQTDHWSHSSLEVIDVNWALRAVAVRLGPTGGIVVWPANGMKKVSP